MSIGSTLFSRMMLAFRAGLQFHGKRNLFEIFGYPRMLRESHLYGKYQRQDITTRIVNMPPEEMWSLEPLLTEPQAILSKWKDFVVRAELWDRVVQADKLCSFGPFSVLMLGLPGDPVGPARPLTDLDQLLYVQAYGGDGVRIEQYENDPRNARFGQPLMYAIRIGPITNTTYINVHYSRVIHIVDRPLQGQMLSEPRLAQVYNILDDLLKIAGGSAELFWITANRGMQVDVDKEMELDAGDAAALTSELDEFQHGLRRYIRTRGVKVTSLGSDVADPTGPFNILMALLAATTNIPQRILMGAEAGQLASEQDRANWAEYIDRRRFAFGVPYVLRPIFKKLCELRYLEADAWRKVTVTWPEAFHMNPVEESNSMAAKARSVVNLSRRNQFGNSIISDEEARVMLDLPEKVPTGHTMPEPPPPTGGGPQSGNPAGGATDAPNAITKGTSNPQSNLLLSAELGEVLRSPDKIEIPVQITLGDTIINVEKSDPAQISVPISVQPAQVSVPVTIEPASVHVPVQINTPETEVTLGDIHVSAELTPQPQKRVSVRKTFTAVRQPDGSLLGQLVEENPLPAEKED
jgi:hypothetical protein